MDDVVHGTKVTLCRGDITEQETKAIVNAANSGLLGGGGVDGAIHRAGGPRILEECRTIRAKQGGCPTGEAVITTGGDLKARSVIHTVGPVWHGGSKGEPELLRATYVNSLELARRKAIGSMAFPSISTGAYGYPIEAAARVALTAILAFLEAHAFEEVKLVLFSQKDLEVYEKVYREVRHLP